MTSTIYTDGSTYDLSSLEAAYLLGRGLIEPHPDRGSVVTANDWRLTADTDWTQITDALADFHHKETP